MGEPNKGDTYTLPGWVLASGYRYIRVKLPPVSEPGIYYPAGYQGASLEEMALGIWHDIPSPDDKPEEPKP